MSGRQTQPYRVGVTRAPSQVLDRMLAGKKLGQAGKGKPLAQAMSKMDRYRPRTSGNTRGNSSRY